MFALRSHRLHLALLAIVAFLGVFVLLSRAAHGVPLSHEQRIEMALQAPSGDLSTAEARAVFAAVEADIGEPVAVLASNMAAVVGGSSPHAFDGDAGPVEDPAPPPPPVERPSLPDPLNEPLSFWDGVKDLRRTGGLWAALALGLAAIFAAARARAVPRPGEPEPPPTSWRARSIAIFAGVGAVLASGGDMLLGLGNWAALFTTVVASASLIWRAFNPPKAG